MVYFLRRSEALLNENVVSLGEVVFDLCQIVLLETHYVSKSRNTCPSHKIGAKPIDFTKFETRYFVNFTRIS